VEFYQMKKILVSVLVSAALATAAAPVASAHDRGGWVGPAIAGVVIGSVLASRPYVVLPQPTYVAPPVQYVAPPVQYQYVAPPVTYVSPPVPREYREKTIIDPMCNCYRNILIPIY
jgi:hypothetical protein